jgi:hypothetical protein
MLSLRDSYHILRWNLAGKPVPPPHVVKQRTIRDYQKRFGLKIFVETGTYLGDMVAAVEPYFAALYSIELGEELYQNARARFAGNPKIQIMHGDSASALSALLQGISEPCLFWLDGHFSGAATAKGQVNFPVLEELDQIRRHQIRDHVILIDDARFFIGAPEPSTQEIVESLRSINPSYSIENSNDIIRATVSRLAAR